MIERLSPRQRACVRLTQEGLTNPKIAQRLGIAHGTVKRYLNRAYEVLDIQYTGSPRTLAAVMLYRHERRDQ